jgi:hypothetical protein
MLIYYLILSVSTLFAYCAKWLKNSYFYWLSLIPVIVFAGLRADVGIDYKSYVGIYNSISDSMTELSFKAINLFANHFDLGEHAVFFISSSLTFLLCYIAIKRLSVDIGISVFVLLFCGFYIESLNIVRQAIAVAIFFFGSQYIVKRQFIKYALCVVVATTFHASAILLIAFYPVMSMSIGKSWIILLILAFVIPIAYPIQNLLESYSPYSRYFLENSDMNTEVVLAFGFMAKCLFGLVCLIYYDRIVSADACAKYYLNGFFLYLFLYILFREFAVVLRFAYYFQIFMVLVIPYILNLFTSSSRKIVLSLVIVYGVLILYTALDNPDNLLIPYNFL